MVFRTREKDDGNFELALDAEGISFLEDGLAELRYMRSGEEVSAPSITSDGASEIMLKRVQDET